VFRSLRPDPQVDSVPPNSAVGMDGHGVHSGAETTSRSGGAANQCRTSCTASGGHVILRGNNDVRASLLGGAGAPPHPVYDEGVEEEQDCFEGGAVRQTTLIEVKETGSVSDICNVETVTDCGGQQAVDVSQTPPPRPTCH